MHPFNPNGLFSVGSDPFLSAPRGGSMPPGPDSAKSDGMLQAPAAYGAGTMPCSRRRAAWVNTAGSFDVTWCVDARGSLIHRDAEPGTLYAWEADHIAPRDRGGVDNLGNLRALKVSGSL